jgi:hypothetical protein
VFFIVVIYTPFAFGFETLFTRFIMRGAHRFTTARAHPVMKRISTSLHPFASAFAARRTPLIAVFFNLTTTMGALHLDSNSPFAPIRYKGT